jgi:hypothetical protein
VAVTIEELAEHMQSSVPTEQAKVAEMQRMLDAALDRVTAECGTAASGTSVVPVVSTGGPQLLLPVARADAVTSVVDPDGRPVTPLAADPYAGIVEVPVPRRGTWRVTVTFGAVPASLELATLIIAAHLYGTQRVPGRGNSPVGAGQAAVPSGFAIPNRAAALMDPYRLPGIA